MATKIDLPDAGWAEIKDPTELTNRDRKLLRRYTFAARDAMAPKMQQLGIKPGTKASEMTDEQNEKLDALITVDDMERVSEAQSAFIVAYTASWSLDRPLPTMDTVDDLPGPVFDRLAAATVDLGDGELDTSVDGAVDPASPTGPSPA
jgi:hypothetical protein